MRILKGKHNKFIVAVCLILALSVVLVGLPAEDVFASDKAEGVMSQDLQNPEEDDSLRNTLPFMSKIGVQYSAYGEEYTLRFVPVFQREVSIRSGFNLDGVRINIEDGALTHWKGDLASGQTVLVIDVTEDGCRVLGLSMQGWDVDGWILCDRLAPVEG